MTPPLRTISAARRIRRSCGFWRCSSKYWAVACAEGASIRYHSGPDNCPAWRPDSRMQALLDLAPQVAFFVTYYLGGIYVATAVLMVAMLALLLLDLLRLRRVPPLHLLSAVLVLALGSATLILRDPRFLKWKPTIFLWLIALASFASPWIGRTPLAQRLLAPMVSGSETVSRATWLKLNWLWVAFFALLGGLNLWVATRASENAWVNFKVIGISAAFALFAIAQALWLAARTEAMAA